MSEEENKEKKEQTAEEVAAIMVENMIKNIQDPDFLNKKDKMLQEAADEVIKKRKERHKK